MLGWVDAWANIMRKVIWKDDQLKQLMKLPSGTNILQFRDRYFIRAGFTNELVTDEICRIVYSDLPGHDTDVPNVRRNIMSFDIYVKDEEMYNVDNDRLKSRADLIASRLYKILTQDRYVAKTGYRFWSGGDYDLGTRTVGYSRKTLLLNYMKVY